MKPGIKVDLNITIEFRPWITREMIDHFIGEIVQRIRQPEALKV
jgi:hypothetical protein